MNEQDSRHHGHECADRPGASADRGTRPPAPALPSRGMPGPEWSGDALVVTAWDLLTNPVEDDD